MPRPTASARAMRMLAVMHLFESGAAVPLESVADALGIPAAEVVDDLNLLACCGVAPYTPDALVPVFVDGGIVMVWGDLPALEHPARLSSGEATAIVAALGIAGVPADDPLVSKLLGAAAAGEVSPEALSQALLAAPEGGQPALRTIALALAEGRVLRLTHQAAGRSESLERTVEPISLVNERGTWYLEAFCRLAGALRTFRLDRIRSAEVLEELAPKRQLSPTGAAFVADGLPTARILLAPAEEVTEREWPGARVIEDGLTGTLVEVPYAGTGWIARQVAARLGAAEVVSPAEVRLAVRSLALSAEAALDRSGDIGRGQHLDVSHG
jgi:proteasome accessory factor C